MSIWILISYMTPTVLSVRSYLLLSSDSIILTRRVKLSKMSKFCLLVKIVIEIQNYILLVNTSPRICSISKTELQITSYNNFRKIETNDLPRKTWLLAEARFKILNLSLHLWCRNESIGGLFFDFESQLALHANDANLNW